MATLEWPAIKELVIFLPTDREFGEDLQKFYGKCGETRKCKDGFSTSMVKCSSKF